MNNLNLIFRQKALTKVVHSGIQSTHGLIILTSIELLEMCLQHENQTLELSSYLSIMEKMADSNLLKINQFLRMLFVLEKSLIMMTHQERIIGLAYFTFQKLISLLNGSTYLMMTIEEAAFEEP